MYTNIYIYIICLIYTRASIKGGNLQRNQKLILASPFFIKIKLCVNQKGDFPCIHLSLIKILNEAYTIRTICTGKQTFQKKRF